MARLKHVVITVTDGRVSLDSGPVTVSRGAQEHVCWHCPQGTATITFSSAPFASDRFVVPRGGSVASGGALGAPGVYAYTIAVRIPGDRRRYGSEPWLVVEA